MTIDDKIRDEKLKYKINREAGKISVLPSGKIGKYEFLTGEGILPSDQSRITEQKSLYILLREKFLKTKQKQLKNKEKNK